MWAGIAQSVKRLATGWSVRGSNPSWGRDFSHPFGPALRPSQPPIQCVSGLFPGVKRLESGVDNPPHLNAEFKESKAISLLRFLTCSRMNLTFNLITTKGQEENCVVQLCSSIQLNSIQVTSFLWTCKVNSAVSNNKTYIMWTPTVWNFHTTLFLFSSEEGKMRVAYKPECK
jgi:hypothetical protein